MDFFKQYIKIINFSLIGLVFAFASFYILANAYHYLELRKDYYVNYSDQTLVKNINKKMENVTKNISTFNSNEYLGNISTNQMMVIQQGLKGCVNSFNNETVMKMRDKTKIGINDVYELREAYEDNVLSDCIVTNLHWTTTITEENFNNTYLLNNKEMISMYVDSLVNATSYVKKDLLNNSSYFYNTSVASAVKDNTKDGFYEVIGAYDKAASFVEFVSEWFKMEVEANYDKNN